jgi:membrane-associated protein
VELIKLAFDVALNLDRYLAELIRHYGALTYIILFVIVFIETGLVVVPFLPGDSLLFAAGTFAALGHFNPYLLFGVLAVATVLGDSVNFRIGQRVGRHAYRSRWVRREYLDRTQAYFATHGGKTVFLARFVPIVRTSAPFVAGMTGMPFRSFLLYNIFGAIAWVGIFVSLGYFFGSLPVVRDHFQVAVLLVLLASVAPGVYHWWKLRRRRLAEAVRRDADGEAEGAGEQ